MRDGAFRGCRGGPNRGREKLALEYLKARRGGGGGGRGNEMGANAAEEQREARRKKERKNESVRKRDGSARETERGEMLLGFRC